MSVTVTPAHPTVGQTIRFHLKYEGNPPPPDDVHVEVEVDGKYQPVVGYDHIPAGMNPVTGFDMPIPPTPNWSSAGTHRFRVRWTRGGQDIGSEAAYVTTSPRPNEEKKEWKWFSFWARVLAGAFGSAIGSALFNWWTGGAIIVCIITGAIGGAIGSGIGQGVVYWFDAPRLRWTFKSAFLFTLFFTLAFFMLFGLLSIGLEKEAAAMGDTYNRVLLGVSFVSAFLSVTLAGVLDNLRNDS